MSSMKDAATSTRDKTISTKDVGTSTRDKVTSMRDMATSTRDAPSSTKDNYRIVLQPPPGNIVAPNGFPADPRPIGAPKTFLDAMEVRIEVFCSEQGCGIEPELDEDDPKSWQWVMYGKKQNPTSDEDLEEPISVIRMVPFPHGPHPNGYHDPEEEPYVKLSRVATVKQARGKGLSKVLIDHACDWLSKHRNEVGQEWNGLVLTHAQVYIEKMYTKMGFVTDEKLGQWDEEGIMHLGMWKKIEMKS